jgi:hypothetical protein
MIARMVLDISLRPEQRGWVALAVAVACLGYLLFRPRFKKKDPLEPPQFGSLAQQRSVERQMQNLLVELSEMTRQMNAQLDTRAAKLEVLLKQADERIAALQRLNGSSSNGPQATSSEPPVQDLTATYEPPPVERAPLPLDPRHEEIYALADQGHGAKEIATRLNRPSGEVELILALRPRV